MEGGGARVADAPRADAAPGGILIPGRTYRITEVLGFWMAEMAEPDWFPVMGPLHDDVEFFKLTVVHYHVDPRFLSVPAERAVRQMRPSGAAAGWHPCYTEVLCHFAWDGGRGRRSSLYINGNRTEVRADNPRGEVISVESRSFGPDRIRRRVRAAECLRPWPRRPGPVEGTAFAALRDAHPLAAGDVCPHRGYDLRAVPVDADGCRRCPLHQLPVRAPKADRPTAGRKT